MEVTGGQVGTVWKVYLILVDPTVTSVTHVLCCRMLSYQVIPLQQHFLDPEQLLTPSHVLMGLLKHVTIHWTHLPLVILLAEYKRDNTCFLWEAFSSNVTMSTVY